jgi:hypothetical protein
MTTLIELVCRAHRQGDGVGPLITRVDDVWAYCEGRSPGDHDWVRIAPTRREELGDLTQMPTTTTSPAQ